jgi:signal transduction histidine kinase
VSLPDRDRPLILVVEDDPTINQFLCRELGKDHDVASAVDGQEGLQRALALLPDLIVTDLMMPLVTGDELVRAARTHRDLDDVPIVVLTATSDESLRLALLRAGAQDFLLKPFALEELRLRVKNLLAMKRVRDVLQRDLNARSQDAEALAREVTQKKREVTAALAEAELARDLAERASRYKSSFLALVTHELRTPLATLRLQLDVLARSDGADDPGKHKRLLTRIDGSYRRLSDLIETLLMYSALEREQVPVRRRQFDVGDVGRAVIAKMHDEAEQKHVQLSYAEEGTVPTMESDPELLKLALTSLVTNAVRFTSRGTVTVMARVSNNALRIAVEDTGPGISLDDRIRIFEPFERVESERTQERPGLGLGLTLARELVLALGGSVEVESEMGLGSCFTLVLPLAAVTGAHVALSTS